MGVAIWGKDFDPSTHDKILEKASEEGFFPSVDVFLPVCNEPMDVLDNTWRHVAALNYSRISVHVLDDGGKEEVRILAKMYKFECESVDGR